MSQSGPPADAKQAQAAALQELELAQRRKRAIDTSLANLESSIYAFEGSYLDETAASGGNIIKGFDNYLKPPTSTLNRKKLEVSEQDRLFSTSSGTYQQSLEAKRQHEHELLAARQTMYYHVQAPHSSHPSAYSTHTHSITQHPTEPTANTVLYPVTLGASIDERVTQRAAASDDAAMMAFFQPPPSPSSSHAGSRQGNKVKKAARTKSTSAQPRKSSKADGD